MKIIACGGGGLSHNGNILQYVFDDVFIGIKWSSVHEHYHMQLQFKEIYSKNAEGVGSACFGCSASVSRRSSSKDEENVNGKELH